MQQKNPSCWIETYQGGDHIPPHHTWTIQHTAIPHQARSAATMAPSCWTRTSSSPRRSRPTTSSSGGRSMAHDGLHMTCMPGSTSSPTRRSLPTVWLHIRTWCNLYLLEAKASLYPTPVSAEMLSPLLNLGLSCFYMWSICLQTNHTIRYQTCHYKPSLVEGILPNRGLVIRVRRSPVCPGGTSHLVTKVATPKNRK